MGAIKGLNSGQFLEIEEAIREGVCWELKAYGDKEDISDCGFRVKRYFGVPIKLLLFCL